jgi:hypothetical protein
MITKFITTRIESIARSAARRRRYAPAHPQQFRPRLTTTRGGHIAAVRFRLRSPPDLYFATHMMNANVWPKGFHPTSPHGEAATHQWDIELSQAEESPTHQQQHSVHSAGGEVTVGEPQQSQSGRYLSTPALRHWEAPRRTTVDACNQPADKRKINRRLKPHRRPCAHF